VRAVERAASLFGLTLPQTLNAASVAQLVSQVREAARAKRIKIGELVARVRDRAERYAPGAPGSRQRSAESAQALVAALVAADDRELVRVLASIALETSETAVGRTLGQVETSLAVLDGAKWQLFDAMGDLADHRRDAAQLILVRLKEALTADEHVVPLKARFEEMERDAVRLLAAAASIGAPGPTATGTPGVQTSTPSTPSEPITPTVPQPGPRTIVVEEAQKTDLSAEEATRVLDELRARLASDQALELTVTWRLQRRGE